MTKHEYLKQLNRELYPIKRKERERSLAYFSEAIDDRMEEGVSEEQAVSELESIEAAAERIISEANELGHLKTARSPWMIALIVLGFPVWFPLLAAVGVVVLTLYLVVWILIGALFIVSIAFALSGILGFIMLFLVVFANPLSGFMSLGLGLCLSGVGIALFIPCVYLAKGFVTATAAGWNAAFRRGKVKGDA